MKSGLSLPDRQPSAGGEEHSGKSQEEQAPGARLKAASQGPCVLSELWSPPLDHADPGLKGWFYKDREAPSVFTGRACPLVLVRGRLSRWALGPPPFPPERLCFCLFWVWVPCLEVGGWVFLIPARSEPTSLGRRNPGCPVFVGVAGGPTVRKGRGQGRGWPQFAGGVVGGRGQRPLRTAGPEEQRRSPDLNWSLPRVSSAWAAVPARAIARP